MSRMDDQAKKPVPQSSHVPEISRRKFVHSVAATGALLTAAALGLGSFPKVANAQDEFVQIEGQAVKVVKLTKKLDVLDRETQPYRTTTAQLPNGGRIVVAGEVTGADGHYSNAIIVPREVSFLVTLNLPNGNVKENNINIHFPKEKDDPSISEDKKGGRGVPIDDFSNLVHKVTGQELKRVQIILEQGTFDYQGNTAKYYQAYVLPIDAQGNRTTSRGPGKYIGYVATYFYYNGGADAGGAGIRLITEPLNNGPLARR